MAKSGGGGGQRGRRTAAPPPRRTYSGPRGADLANRRGEALRDRIMGNPVTARAGSMPPLFVDRDGRLWGSDFGGRGGVAHRVMNDGRRGETKKMSGRTIYPVTRAQADSVYRAGRFLRYVGDERYGTRRRDR